MGITVGWTEVDGTTCLRIGGWTVEQLGLLRHGDPAQLVAVYCRSLPAGVPPVAGTYVVRADAVVFVPRFPFVDGTSYAVVPEPALDASPAVITRPSRVADARAQVLAVYPSHSTLPRNALRFYVHFSDPMSEGLAGDHVRLLPDDGDPIEDVFVRDPELWDRTRRRLTVLLDPGRIKRGLVPHAQAGYPLETGVRVRLTVDRGFLDADGGPLVDDFAKLYEIAADVRARVDPRAWDVRSPDAGGVRALVVGFDRPLDRGLLEHALRVHDADGRPVAGRVQVGPGELSWTFTPDASWSAGTYRLTVDAALEDVAGNSVTRVFDRDLGRPEDDPLTGEAVAVDFVV